MRKSVKVLSLVAKAVLVLVCLVMVIPSVIRLCPSLVGADASYVVLGGSMKPTLCPGDLAFTVKVDPAEVEVGDIIAVRTESKVYMHRVVEKKMSDGVLVFRLKGDANEESDANYVAGSDFIGKTVFSLPMGYIYTKNGYMLIVATPLMVLAAYQAVKIYRLYDTRKRMRRGLKAILLGKGGRRRRKVSIFDATSALLLIILVAGGTYMMAPYFISGSGSFFTDTESSRNVIGAATWRVSSSITCSVSPSNITLGENVTISGIINPARSAEFIIKYRTVGDWVELITVTSDVNGRYEYEWKPGIGTYEIKASWEGDHSHFGASSNIVTVSVAEGG